MSMSHRHKIYESKNRQKDELVRIRSIFLMLIRLSVENKPSYTEELYTMLTNTIRNSIINREMRKEIMKTARDYTFIAYRNKIDDLLQKAHEAAEDQDDFKKSSIIRVAYQYLNRARYFTDDRDVILQIQETIATALETNVVDASDSPQYHSPEAAEANNHLGEKRRHLRYASPSMLVQIDNSPEIFEVKNFSVSGLRIDGLAESFRVGDRIHLSVSLVREAQVPSLEGVGAVARVSTTPNLIGIKFVSSFEGPIMDFIRAGQLDGHLQKPLVKLGPV